MSLVDRARHRLSGRRTPRDRRQLVARVDALEKLVEGLQDSVDRQVRRHDEQITELAHRLEPAELSRAISGDARKRGI